MCNKKEYIERYLAWKGKTKDDELHDRKERIKWYAEKMGSAERIDKLSEKDIYSLVERLWALNFWKNKHYKVQKLIDDNGIDKLKSSLKMLLYSAQPIEQRWDMFRETVKGIGKSSLSEILTLVFPEEYGIMNMKPFIVLPELGYIAEEELGEITKGAVTTGEDYHRFMKALSEVKKDLQNNGMEKANYIDVDFFIYYVFQYDPDFQEIRVKMKSERKEEQIEPLIEAKKKEKIAGKITSHTEAENILLKLGRLFEYDTYSPDKIKEAYGEKNEEFITLKEMPQFGTRTLMDTIENIDVIWFKDEETPVGCFEVEHTTGVTSGLLRLYQINEQLNTKLFIIAPAEVIKKFETELNKKPFNKMKHKYIFKSYEELYNFYQAAENYTKLKKDFFNEKV